MFWKLPGLSPPPQKAGNESLKVGHELAHLRQLNHSDKFWREVEWLCPGYLSAEK